MKRKYRYFEDDNDVKLHTGTLLDSPTMAADAEEVIGGSSSKELQYDASEDPEQKKSFSEVLKKNYLKKAYQMSEGFSLAEVINSYLKENPGSFPDEFDIADYIDPSVTKSAAWKKKHPEEIKDFMEKHSLGKYSEDAVEEEPISFDDEDDFTKGLVSAGEEAAKDESLSDILSAKERANKKYRDLYGVARSIIHGRIFKRHAFIYGDPGIGKTYSVKLAAENEFPNSALKSKGYEIEFTSGDIGTSLSPLLAFFYPRRNKKIIILDDCDGFLVQKDDKIQNFLKALLEMDNTEKNPKYITSAKTNRNFAARLMDDAELEESTEISIDKDLFREGILSVNVNGVNIGKEPLTRKSLKTLKEGFKSFKPRLKESLDYFDLEVFNESSVEVDDDTIDVGDLDDVNLNNADDVKEIPAKWRFASRVILISNLNETNLNAAVNSRCISYNMHLEEDEFVARLSGILPNMLRDAEVTTNELEQEYSRNVAFSYVQSAVSMATKRYPFLGHKIKIDKRALQFRIIPEIASLWIIEYDDFLSLHPEYKGKTTTKEGLDEINNKFKVLFMKNKVIPSLEKSAI